MNEELDMVKLGSFIKEMRKQRGITQKELGEQIGVSDKAVSKWERGLSFPDITLLPGLSKTLHVSIGELIASERQKENVVSVETMQEVVNKTMQYSKKSYLLKNRKLLIRIMLGSIVLSGMICLLIDVVLNQAISWSLYPIGASCILVLPMLVAIYCKTNTLEYVALTLVITIIGYLTMIEHLTNTNNWLLQIGIPIVSISCISVYSVVKAWIVINNKYYATAISFLILAIGPFLTISSILYVYDNSLTNYYACIIEVPICLIAAYVLYKKGRVKKIR